jgi:hypothetical protein
MATQRTVCPGCGVRLPPTRLVLDRRLNATPECWHLYGEVAGFGLSRPELIVRFQQLTVDSYGAQHAGGESAPIGVAYGLVGLHLALDRGLSGLQVRDAHQRMGRPDGTWPDFDRPAGPRWLTVLQVAEAGVRADSAPGHARAVGDWAASVWRAWAARHGEVAALTDRLLATYLARLRPAGNRGGAARET